MNAEANVMESRSVPSDMQQVVTVAKYDLKKHLRSKRLLGMLIIEALIIVLLTVLQLTQPAQPYSLTVGSFAGFAGTLIIIGATLFAGDAIVSEFQGRRGYLLFPNPVKRISLLLGKFISASLATALVVLIYYAAAFIVGIAISSNLEHIELGLASLALALLYSVSAVSLGMLISSIMKSSVASLILTFFLLLMILPIVDGVFAFISSAPWFSLTFSAQTVQTIMVFPYPVTEVVTLPVTETSTMTLYQHVPNVAISVAVMAIYAVVAMVIAYFLFRRKEMTA